jgi:hypothetical protein
MLAAAIPTLAELHPCKRGGVINKPTCTCAAASMYSLGSRCDAKKKNFRLSQFRLLVDSSCTQVWLFCRAGNTLRTRLCFRRYLFLSPSLSSINCVTSPFLAKFLQMRPLLSKRISPSPVHWVFGPSDGTFIQHRFGPRPRATSAFTLARIC